MRPEVSPQSLLVPIPLVLSRVQDVQHSTRGKIVELKYFNITSLVELYTPGEENKNIREMLKCLNHHCHARLCTFIVAMIAIF